ncbi:MAG: cobalamin-dependent protein [bacterium]|nr:cobalamin-dependent protein [bacterium]
MKILFVEKKLRMDKLGICYLSAVLKKAGHEVDLVQDEEENADKYLAANPVDFVMYSVTSDEADWFAKRNQELKTKHHRFISVVGGSDPTFMPSRWTQDPAIDYVVQGPGESVILSIVNGLAPRLSRGELLGRFEYSSPDRSIIYKYDELGKARMKRFIACRYCLFSCTHCFNHAFKKMYLDQKSFFTYRPSPEIMIQEVIAVKNEYGLELAYFNDDDLADNPDWLEKFCKLLLANDIPSFCGSIRANSVDEKTVIMMARSGCKLLNVSIESANAETQKLLRRGGVTNDDVYKAVRWCEEAGIKVRTQNMIGLPVEDPLADALETFEFNKRCHPLESVVTIYQPLPGTELWSYCIKKGLIDGNVQPTNFQDKTVLKIKDTEKINRLARYWYWAIKKEWSVEFLKEQLNNPIPDEVLKEMTQTRWATSKKELYGL